MACLRSSGSFIRFLIIHTAHTHTHCVVQEQYFIVFVSAYTLSINACCQTCVRRRSRAPLIQTYASYMAETNRSTQTTHRCVLDHALRAGIKKTVHHAKVAVRIHSIVFLWALCRLNILTNPCPLSNMSLACQPTLSAACSRDCHGLWNRPELNCVFVLSTRPRSSQPRSLLRRTETTTDVVIHSYKIAFFQ